MGVIWTFLAVQIDHVSGQSSLVVVDCTHAGCPGSIPIANRTKNIVVGSHCQTG